MSALGVLKFDDKVVADEAKVMYVLYHLGVKLIRLESSPRPTIPKPPSATSISYVISL